MKNLGPKEVGLLARGVRTVLDLRSRVFKPTVALSCSSGIRLGITPLNPTLETGKLRPRERLAANGKTGGLGSGSESWVDSPFRTPRYWPTPARKKRVAFCLPGALEVALLWGRPGVGPPAQGSCVGQCSLLAGSPQAQTQKSRGGDAAVAAGSCQPLRAPWSIKGHLPESQLGDSQSRGRPRPSVSTCFSLARAARCPR